MERGVALRPNFLTKEIRLNVQLHRLPSNSLQPSTTNQQGFPIKIIHIDNYKMMQLAATQSTGAVQSFSFKFHQ